jgi:hypothetical protein
MRAYFSNRLWPALAGIQDKQPYLQLGLDDVLRERHEAIPTVRARLADAKEPGAIAAASTQPDWGRDAGRTARGAEHRVPGRRCERTSRAESSRLRSGSSTLFQARGRRSRLRGRRMSSAQGRGCGFICVRGTCLGLRCDC